MMSLISRLCQQEPSSNPRQDKADLFHQDSPQSVHIQRQIASSFRRECWSSNAVYKERVSPTRSCVAKKQHLLNCSTTPPVPKITSFLILVHTRLHNTFNSTNHSPLVTSISYPSLDPSPQDAHPRQRLQQRTPKGRRAKGRCQQTPPRLARQTRLPSR